MQQYKDNKKLDNDIQYEDLDLSSNQIKIINEIDLDESMIRDVVKLTSFINKLIKEVGNIHYKNTYLLTSEKKSSTKKYFKYKKKINNLILSLGDKSFFREKKDIEKIREDYIRRFLLITKKVETFIDKEEYKDNKKISNEKWNISNGKRFYFPDIIVEEKFFGGSYLRIVPLVKLSESLIYDTIILYKKSNLIEPNFLYKLFLQYFGMECVWVEFFIDNKYINDIEDYLFDMYNIEDKILDKYFLKSQRVLIRDKNVIKGVFMKNPVLENGEKNES